MHASRAAGRTRTQAGLAHLARTLGSLPPGAVVLVDGIVGVRPPGRPRRRRAAGCGSWSLCTCRSGTPWRTGAGHGRESTEPGRAASAAVLAAAAAVLTTSRWTADWLTDRVRPGRRAAARGPSGSRPRPGRRTAPPSGAALLSVAAVVPAKGHAELLDALATLRDHPWRLVCAGAHRPRTRPRRTPARDGAREAGNRRPGRLRRPPERRQPRAGVCRGGPARACASRIETYGLVITEALAQGGPVVGDRGRRHRGGDGQRSPARPGTVPGIARARTLERTRSDAWAVALRSWLADDGPAGAVDARPPAHRRTTLAPWSATAQRVSAVLSESRARAMTSAPRHFPGSSRATTRGREAAGEPWTRGIRRCLCADGPVGMPATTTHRHRNREPSPQTCVDQFRPDSRAAPHGGHRGSSRDGSDGCADWRAPVSAGRHLARSILARRLLGWRCSAVVVWRPGADAAAGCYRRHRRRVALAVGPGLTALTTVCCAWRWSLVASRTRRRRAAADAPSPTATARSSSTRRLRAGCSATCTGACGTAGSRATQAGVSARWSGSGRCGSGGAGRDGPRGPVRAAVSGAVAVWPGCGAPPSSACSVTCALAHRMPGAAGRVGAVGSLARSPTGGRSSRQGRAWPAAPGRSSPSRRPSPSRATSSPSSWPPGLPGRRRRRRGWCRSRSIVLVGDAGIPMNIAGWGPREGVAAWVFGAAGLGARRGTVHRGGLRRPGACGQPAGRRRDPGEAGASTAASPRGAPRRLAVPRLRRASVVSRRRHQSSAGRPPRA